MPKGLKLNNQKSNIAPPTNSNLEAFNQAADEAAERLSTYKKRSWDLGVKFKSLMETTILPENKTSLIKDLENEVLQQLSQLATEINIDTIQPEGSGGVALCQLIMKMLLLQKDTTSKLLFRITSLEKIVAEFKKPE